MTSLILAFAIQGELPKATDILSKVLEKYAAANSISGDVLMTQTAGPKKVTIKTELAIERPSKLLIHQTSEAIAPNDWLVVSDGVKFGYDVPSQGEGAPRRRLFEEVAVTESATGQKRLLKAHSIYLAAKRSLGDNINPFVEFTTQSVGENSSLKGFLLRLANISPTKEKSMPDGSKAYSIWGVMNFGDRIKDAEGNLTDKFESAGRFEMTVSKDFDLIGMRTTETISVTDAGTNLPTQISVITNWTGKVTLNGTVDASKFTVK